jgi:predicted metalloprotease with PDZ domain
MGRKVYVLGAFLVFVITVCAVSQTTEVKDAPTIAFTVSMSKPHTHMLEVAIDIKRTSTDVPQEDLFLMPVWTPGSYLIREFARHVQDFSVQDNHGKPLQWEKTNKNSWRIVTAGAREYRVNYRVYANSLSARTNELNSDHAFWTNAALLMYLDGWLSSPSTLQILSPEPWKIATGLPAVAGQKNTFRAENFDILYDSPVEVSNFKTIAFEVKGVPHRIVIDGEGNYEPEKIRADVKKIVETEIAIMGGEVPYRDYTFFLHLRDNGDGLEHLNSTALVFPRFNFKSGEQYRSFLTLVAHEFFHLWNVKRIRPDPLGPFDYTKENYTKLLWVAEGFASYYENLVVARAKLITTKQFLSDAAASFQRLQNRPGRMVMSAEEASFDAWIKFYRPDENAINSQVDYYEKGAILGLLLDLHIRKLSGGRKSLDDVMRYLYTEFFKKNRNYTPEDFQRACELMAGASLETFFGKYVRGREELNYNEALEAAGLMLNTIGPSDNKPEPKAYLGAELVQEGERLLVRVVTAGSPAYEQGLNTGDQIVAVNNVRATKSFLESRLAEKRPGDSISLTIFRLDDLSTLLIKLGGRTDVPYTIAAIPAPSDLQRRIYESWLGTAWGK